MRHTGAGIMVRPARDPVDGFHRFEIIEADEDGNERILDTAGTLLEADNKTIKLLKESVETS